MWFAMKPSVGRVVHFVNSKKNCQAAIITAVTEDQKVSLAVFGLKDTTYESDLNQSDEKSSHTWHEPERV